MKTLHLMFDIFTGIPGKDTRWIEAVDGLSNARARMEQVDAQKPGAYFLFYGPYNSVLDRIETFGPAKSRAT